MHKKAKYISVLLMVAMFLIGSLGTLAWFTSSASSQSKIEVGTLNIENDDSTGTTLFDDEIWGPNESKSDNFRIKNIGNLDARIYAVSIDGDDLGDGFLESFTIEIKVGETTVLDSTSLKNLKDNQERFNGDGYTLGKEDEEDDSATFNITLKMVDSGYQGESRNLNFVFHATQNYDAAVTAALE